jgi:uncharacterized UPF0146 family protein
MLEQPPRTAVFSLRPAEEAQTNLIAVSKAVHQIEGETTTERISSAFGIDGYASSKNTL